MTDDYLTDPDYGDPGYAEPDYGETDYDPAYLDSLAADDTSGYGGYEAYEDYGDYEGEPEYPDYSDDPYLADYEYDYDDQPEQLTYDQIRQIVRDESDRLNRESWSEEEMIDRAVQRTAQAMEAHYAERVAEFFDGPMWELLSASLDRLSQSEKDKLLSTKSWEETLAVRARARQLDELRTQLFRDFVVETCRQGD